MGNVLIFGGSVFIGKAIADKFIGEGHKVYVLNRGNHPCPKGAIQLKADRNNQIELEEALQGLSFDIVVDGSAYEPLQSKLAVRLLRERCNHFIHVSSAAVYEDSEVLPYMECSKRGASKSWGIYSKNKFEIEEFLFQQWENEKFPISIVRPFYVYGPNNNLERESYVFSRLLEDKTIVIPGRGLPMIQFGHIDDLCQAIYTISKNEKCYGEAYNVSGSEFVTFKGWVESCGKALGIEAKVEMVDTKSTGHVAREWFPFRDINMIGSCNKIENHTGFKPKYSLVEGLKHTFENSNIQQLKESMKIGDVEKKLLKEMNSK